MTAGAVIHRLDAEFVGEGTETVLMAFDNGVPVGTVRVKHKDRRTAQITWLFVKPEFRRVGVASALLDTCAELAAASNCRSMGLLVVKKNWQKVGGFYERRGFAFGYEYDNGDVLLVATL